ncbi:MAG: FAD-dependent oxidoreductase [Crocinitomicaceae bacterium]
MIENKQQIVVGWGLAGTIVSWHLYLKGIPFRVIDSGVNHSSKVAAGLVNPVVFKRLTKSWEADKLIPEAKLFYQTIGKHLGYDLASQIPINRIFGSIEEQNNWSAMIGDGRFGDHTQPAQDFDHPLIDTPFGVGKVTSLGNIDTKKFLEESKGYLIKNGVDFQTEKFDYKVDDSSNYIFCEGAEVTHNPFFNYLPMKPTHGDILTIRSSSLKLHEVVNKNMFVLPLGDDLYKVGATYNWDLQEAIPTAEGKTELIEKLKSFTHFDFEIVSHEAGIRPTVNDRRPLLGQHPKHKNLFIFNGLGTKGVMIAPFYAAQLINFIDKKGELDEAVNIKRHEKHYNA